MSGRICMAMAHALSLVVVDKWSISEAARKCKVSRRGLTYALKREKQKGKKSS